jgi:hypothetical protein
VLRAGNAGSNTAADHIEAARLAVAQLPRHLRRRVMVRADSGGGTHEKSRAGTRIIGFVRNVDESLGQLLLESTHLSTHLGRVHIPVVHPDFKSPHS